MLFILTCITFADACLTLRLLLLPLYTYRNQLPADDPLLQRKPTRTDRQRFAMLLVEYEGYVFLQVEPATWPNASSLPTQDAYVPRTPATNSTGTGHRKLQYVLGSDGRTEMVTDWSWPFTAMGTLGSSDGKSYHCSASTIGEGIRAQRALGLEGKGQLIRDKGHLSRQLLRHCVRPKPLIIPSVSV
jgi:hypothetical protein